jgi:hypothetical protein
MIIRGGQFYPWIIRPVNDPVNTPADLARAATLDARYAAHGVCEAERHKIVPCAMLKARWPETQFTSEIEKRLAELSVK